LPERYGNWKTVYNRFANWSRAGHFERIFKALRLKVGPSPSAFEGRFRIAASHSRCPIIPDYVNLPSYPVSKQGRVALLADEVTHPVVVGTAAGGGRHGAW
jgi:transposase